MEADQLARKERRLTQPTACGIVTRAQVSGRRAVGNLTRRVSADVAGVLLRDALLQQPQAHAVLPTQTLVTLPGDRGAPGHR